MLQHTEVFPRNSQHSDSVSKSAVVATYDTHEHAEATVRELQKSGFDMQKLSIVGKDYRTEQEVVGYYTAGDRMMSWGKTGAFWGAIWTMLFGSAFFLVPGVGPLLVAGPLVAWIVAVLEGAAIVGGFSALGGALASIGIPEDSIVQYETQIKAGRFLVIAHGSPDEVSSAKIALDASTHAGIQHHACSFN